MRLSYLISLVIVFAEPAPSISWNTRMVRIRGYQLERLILLNHGIYPVNPFLYPGDFLASVDIKDAYLHISILQHHCTSNFHKGASTTTITGHFYNWIPGWLLAEETIGTGPISQYSTNRSNCPGVLFPISPCLLASNLPASLQCLRTFAGPYCLLDQGVLSPVPAAEWF